MGLTAFNRARREAEAQAPAADEAQKQPEAEAQAPADEAPPEQKPAPKSRKES